MCGLTSEMPVAEMMGHSVQSTTDLSILYDSDCQVGFVCSRRHLCSCVRGVCRKMEMITCLKNICTHIWRQTNTSRIINCCDCELKVIDKWLKHKVCITPGSYMNANLTNLYWRKKETRSCATPSSKSVQINSSGLDWGALELISQGHTRQKDWINMYKSEHQQTLTFCHTVLKSRYCELLTKVLS